MPVTRPFPTLQFDLVSFDTPQGRTPPYLEVSAVGETFLPESFAARSAADQL